MLGWQGLSLHLEGAAFLGSPTPQPHIGLPPVPHPHSCSPSPALWPAGVSPGFRAKPVGSGAGKTSFMVTGGQWCRRPLGSFPRLRLARGRLHGQLGQFHSQQVPEGQEGPNLQRPARLCPPLPLSLFPLPEGRASLGKGHSPHPQPLVSHPRMGPSSTFSHSERPGRGDHYVETQPPLESCS